jgi:colanic acid biosynthesis glycosyl transferase WcaI
MRILVVSQWAHPEPNAVASVYAREWARQGHEVTLLTGFPNYPSGRIYPGYKLRPWLVEKRDGVKYLRCWLFPDHSNSGLKRIANYLSFALSATFVALLKAERPDVIWTYHPPLTAGLVSFALSCFWNRRFVFAVHDLWPQAVAASGMLRQRWALDLLQRLASFLYRRSHAIITVSSGFQQALLDDGVPPEKVSTIYNFADSDRFFPKSFQSEVLARYGFTHPFRIVYGGNIGFAQRLETVIECAGLLKSNPDVGFYLFGDGTERVRLSEQAQRLHLHNVKFLGRVEEHLMSDIFSVADILLLQLQDSPVFRITIPSKLQSYMASGRPILCGSAGEASELVLKAQSGVTYDSSNAQSLKIAIETFLNCSQNQRAQFGANARQFFLENFSLDRIVSKHLDVLSRLATSKRSA